MEFAEFFAGVGLVREGLETDNWVCAWANDISASKKETYIENYGDDDFCHDDIWNIARRPEMLPNDLFLYTASFPCTDLSVAGGRAGLAGEESGTLNAFFKILSAKQKSGSAPKVVMLENVKGFLTSHNGKDIADTVKQFSSLGYVTDIIELDAVLFTPQSRPRVFLIAVDDSLANKIMHIKQKGKIIDDWWASFEQFPLLRSNKVRTIVKQNEDLDWGIIRVPLPKIRKGKLADIIETNIPDESELWWNEERKKHLFTQMSMLHKTRLSEMIENNEYSYGTVYRRVRKGGSMAELRTDGIAGCLRTPRGGSSKQILVRAGGGKWDVRLLTPREYARLQGVRDNFKMPLNANKGYFAMGDAVCVPVISHLSQHALVPLYKAYIEANSIMNKAVASIG